MVLKAYCGGEGVNVDHLHSHLIASERAPEEFELEMQSLSTPARNVPVDYDDYVATLIR